MDVFNPAQYQNLNLADPTVHSAIRERLIPIVRYFLQAQFSKPESVSDPWFDKLFEAAAQNNLDQNQKDIIIKFFEYDDLVKGKVGGAKQADINAKRNELTEKFGNLNIARNLYYILFIKTA